MALVVHVPFAMRNSSVRLPWAASASIWVGAVSAHPELLLFLLPFCSLSWKVRAGAALSRKWLFCLAILRGLSPSGL